MGDAIKSETLLFWWSSAENSGIDDLIGCCDMKNMILLKSYTRTSINKQDKVMSYVQNNFGFNLFLHLFAAKYFTSPMKSISINSWV